MSSASPQPPPLPPADFATRRLLTETVTAGEIIHRFHSAAHDPLHYDRGPDGRLNAPDTSYGVLYAARDLRGAFAETFLRKPGRTQLPPDLLAKKAYATLRVQRPLQLVKLAGVGLGRAGATAQVVHGGLPYDAAQAWSAAIWRRAEKFDGVAYYARHDDEALCIALFDRDPPPVEIAMRKRSLDEGWFWEVAEIYDVGTPPA